MWREERGERREEIGESREERGERREERAEKREKRGNRREERGEDIWKRREGWGDSDLWSNEGEIVCNGGDSEPGSRLLLREGGSRALVNAVNWPS